MWAEFVDVDVDVGILGGRVGIYDSVKLQEVGPENARLLRGNPSRSQDENMRTQ